MDSSFPSVITFRFPSEATKNVALLNEGPRTTFLSLKEGVSYYSSVDQVVYILERSPTRAIIKVERTEKELIQAIKSAKGLQEGVSEKNKEIRKLILRSYWLVHFKTSDG